jgi:hypothetical protein
MCPSLWFILHAHEHHTPNQKGEVMLRKMALHAVIGAALLLSGCLMSETPALSEKDSGNAPDISGEYTSDELPDKPHFVVTRKDNAYAVTNRKQKTAKPSVVLVEKLDAHDAILLQISDESTKGQYILISALVQKDGLTVFPGVDGNKSVLEQIFKKHGLTFRQGLMQQGSMTPEQYKQAVKAAFVEMLAAKALGKGALLKKQ